MSNWEYLKDTDMPKGKSYIVRKKGIDVEDWNSQRKTWQENSNAMAAFIGIEGHYKEITEREAIEIINSYK